MTVGMLACLVSRTALTSACESIGARQMPSTPAVIKFCTRSICAFRSSSICGAFHWISTFPNSLAAFSAPACTDFQNSCVAALGMTAILSFFPEAPVEPDAPAVGLFGSLELEQPTIAASKKIQAQFQYVERFIVTPFWL